MTVVFYSNQYCVINAENVKIQKLETSKNKYAEKKMTTAHTKPNTPILKASCEN